MLFRSTTLMGRLRHQKEGPGSFRFGEAADETFFAQLTAEKMRTRHDKQGGLVREWFCPSGKRNEQLDCLVYAYAVLLLHRRRYNAETYWQQMESRLKPAETPSTVADGEQPKRESRAALRSRQPAPRRNFTTSW